MQAKAMDILDFLINDLENGSEQKKCFVIPPFQRNYAWQKEQMTALVDDILNAESGKKPHYLGNILFYKGERSADGVQEVMLVDGQQRITTLMLMLCAIREQAKSRGDSEIADEAEKYLENRTADDNYRIRLKQALCDREAFGVIMTGGNDFKNDSLVTKNWLSLAPLCREDGYKKLFGGIKRLQIVAIDLGTENDLQAAQTVYERINSTGKPLINADLIRNYLLLSPSADLQELYYTEYWLKIERQIGNDSIDDFTHDFLVVKTQKALDGKKYFLDFKKWCETQDKEKVLSEMLDYARCYVLLTKKDKRVLAARDGGLSDALAKAIDETIFVGSKSFYPLFMHLLHEKDQTSFDELARIFTLFCDYIVRCRIASEDQNSFDKNIPVITAEFLKNIISPDDEKSKIALTYDAFLFELSNVRYFYGSFPDNDKFKSAMEFGVKRGQAKLSPLIFLRIEEKMQEKKFDINKVKCQPVMPDISKNEQKNLWWNDYLGGRAAALAVNDKCLNLIGNQIALYGDEKIEQAADFKGTFKRKVKGCKFEFTRKMADFDEWNEKNITERNKEITELAIVALTSPRPRTRDFDEFAQSDGWENVRSIGNISDRRGSKTHKTISLRFRSDVYEERHVSYIFYQACKICRKYNPEEFYEYAGDKGNNYVSLTDPQGASRFERLQDGGTTYYICVNFSAKDSLNHAVEIFEKFGITDEVAAKITRDD